MTNLHDARLEAAAKIIRRASFGEQSDPDEVWSDCHESERERWRVAARRTLAAADAVVTVETIAEVIGKSRTTSIRGDDGYKSVVMESNETIARAVLALIRGETETSE